MKKLTTILLIACLTIAVSCADQVNSSYSVDVKSIEEQAKLSIEEEGGTPDRTEAAIKEFLQVPEFQGVYNTVSGYAGYRIKDGKLYEIVAAPITGTEWKEVTSFLNIAVDKNLKKLQVEEEDGSVVKVFTFDGYGYYIYENDFDDLATYYAKNDFPEKYVGYYTSANKSVRVTIENTGRVKYMHGKYGNWDYITGNCVFKGNVLTVRGAYWNGEKVVFGEDGSITCYAKDGTEIK